MTCASCVRNVERALNKARGCAGVNVNLATEKRTVRICRGLRGAPIGQGGRAAGYGRTGFVWANKARNRCRTGGTAGGNCRRSDASLSARLTIRCRAEHGACICHVERDMRYTNIATEWLMWAGWPVILLLATPVQIIVGGRT